MVCLARPLQYQPWNTWKLGNRIDVMEKKYMLKRTVLSVFCAAALFTGAAYAQDSATLTLIR